MVPASQALAQRRPGFEPRRHSGVSAETWCSLNTLNEGRGSNPGDTRPWTFADWTIRSLPGLTPGDTTRHAAQQVRSTKAGVRTPATPCPCREPLGQSVSNPGDTSSVDVHGPLSSATAQRRPGFEPRRHMRRRTYDLVNEGLRQSRRHVFGSRWGGQRVLRSTKAGVRTPATLRLYSWHMLSPTKAGVRTPAPSPRRSAGCRCPHFAQRRPGFEPRRHLSASVSARSEGRGSNPGRHPQHHIPRRPRATPLNEGRGSNPGDTANPIRESLPRKIAQICGHQIPCSHAD